MIVIPEIEKVLILVPRTGTTSLIHAVSSQYQKAFLLFRHMEADGIPQQYQTWENIAILRHPLERLWSLYNFIKQHQPTTPYWMENKRSVQRPFEEWLLNNDLPFSRIESGDQRDLFYSSVHHIPETRKSTVWYCNTATIVHQYSELSSLFRTLCLEPCHLNDVVKDFPPQLSSAGQSHLEKYFDWDLQRA
jgi:hypothetical protein